MRWWQRVLGLLSAAVIVLVGVLLVVDTADEAVDRFRARGGALADGTVVDRWTGYRNVFPNVTVEYAVGGRTYARDIEGFLDLDERVQVRYLREEPAVSRVVGEGGPALLADALTSVLLLGVAPYGARVALADLRRPAAPPRERTLEPERPGDRTGWRRRVTRGGVVGAAAGGALWVALAALLGAGPPREIATALLGTVGSGSAVGALVGLLASGGGLRRAGRGTAYRLGVVGLVLAVPAVLVLAAALEA